MKKISFLFLAIFFLVGSVLYAETVNPQKFLQDAYQLIGQQEYDKALVILNRVIGMNYKSAPAYFNRGMIFLGKKYTDQAMSDFDEAVRIDPNFAAAYMAKAKVYFDQEKWDDAILQLNKALKADRKFGLAYYNRALAYEKKNEFGKAFSDYKKAKLYGVDVPGQELERVWTLGHFSEILAKSAEEIRKNPNSGEAYYNLGIAYYHKKDYPKALENFEKSQQLGTKVDPELLRELGNQPKN